MSAGQDAVASRYGAQVWDFIYFSPARERDDVLVYSRESNYCQEMAQERYDDVMTKVRRAERDAPYALDWAKRAIRQMHDPWTRMSLDEKMTRAKQQDYDDAVSLYKRLIFSKVTPKEPFESLHPEQYRAYHDVMREADVEIPDPPAESPANPDPAHIGSVLAMLTARETPVERTPVPDGGPQ